MSERCTIRKDEPWRRQGTAVLAVLAALVLAGSAAAQGAGETAVVASIERMASSTGSDNLVRFVQGLPDPAFSPLVRSALLAALPALVEPPGPENAALIGAICLSKAPEELHTRKVVARAWMLGGWLERALDSLAHWQRERPADPDFVRLRTEAYLLALRPDLASGVLGPLGGLGARPPLMGRSAWLRRAIDVILLEGTPMKDVAGRPEWPAEGDARLTGLLKELERAGGAGLAVRLNACFRELHTERKYVDAAVALAARRALGGLGDPETILEADLCKGIREFERELRVLAPLEARIQCGDHLKNGMPDATLIFRVARATFHTGRLADTDRLLFTARLLGKNDSEMCFHQAWVRRLQRRPGESTALLLRAIEMKPADKYVKLAREELIREGYPLGDSGHSDAHSDKTLSSPLSPKRQPPPR